METKEIEQIHSIDDVVPVYNAEMKNVLIIGKSGVGKSTIFQTVQNSSHIPPPRKLFAQTSKPVLHPIVTIVDGKHYSINVIDTPGLYEVRRNAEEKRTNDQILNLVQSCINQSVTSLSTVMVTFKLGDTLTDQDISLIHILKSFLPSKLRQNTILVFTHAEDVADDQIKDRVAEFEKDGSMKDLRDLCAGGVFFFGTTDCDRNCKYKSYKEEVLPSVKKMRTELLKQIVSMKLISILPESAISQLLEFVSKDKMCRVM